MRKFSLLFAAIVSLNLMATEGALNGGFTINKNGDRVQFSKGNLQYVGTWQFAANQWEIFGKTQSDNHRDLFGWGTGDAPNKCVSSNDDYTNFSEWGANPITNGGNTANAWYTLTGDEWNYIFSSRTNAATLFGLGSVNGVNGTILLPDDWATPIGLSFIASTTRGLKNGNEYSDEGNNHYADNTYTADQWKVMESNGAVFLPAAGYRWNSSDVYFADTAAYYWSNMPSATYYAYFLYFVSDGLYPLKSSFRSYGFSVRLVQPYVEVDAVVPEAKTLTGRFSVAADKQVIFSQGNLQYYGRESRWQFAANQYDMIGQNNAYIAETYKGKIDLFGWGTSGYNDKYPYMTSVSENQYGNGANDIAGTDYDWGVFATIANGNDEAWRTLTKAEWEYMLQTRANAADKWGNATVDGVPGMVILPDTWTLPAGLSFTAQQPDWTTNTYTADQWTQLENAGAIFLPAAARRDGTTIMSIDADVRRGYYWTSTANGNGSAYAVRFMEDDPLSLFSDLRLMGFAVRLARDKKANEAIENVESQEPRVKSQKILRDGMLYIVRPDGKTYNAQGAEVK